MQNIAYTSLGAEATSIVADQSPIKGLTYHDVNLHSLATNPCACAALSRLGANHCNLLSATG
eukprot:13986569-Heterocapsa_arctica.AAC.1